MTTDLMPTLTKADSQLQEIQASILSKNYGALQGLLLQQSIVLHEIGMFFVERANEQEPIRNKRTCLDLAFRAFSQSRKAMMSIKNMEAPHGQEQ
ncbi:MAG: hypothetical protein JZU65_22305 [Chlorobium sp.]|nr:hypothetical protein [Chlorobium sp.]